MIKFAKLFNTHYTALYLYAAAIISITGWVFSTEADNWALAFYFIAPLLPVYLLGGVFAILGPLERYIRYLTHDQAKINLRDIVTVEGENVVKSWLVYSALIYVIWLVGLIIWLLPFSMILVLGLLYGVSRLTRFAFGVGAKLKTHVADPDAHKNIDRGK